MPHNAHTLDKKNWILTFFSLVRINFGTAMIELDYIGIISNTDFTKNNIPPIERKKWILTLFIFVRINFVNVVIEVEYIVIVFNIDFIKTNILPLESNMLIECITRSSTFLYNHIQYKEYVIIWCKDKHDILEIGLYILPKEREEVSNLLINTIRKKKGN
jgi:hypothetical protein